MIQPPHPEKIRQGLPAKGVSFTVKYGAIVPVLHTEVMVTQNAGKSVEQAIADSKAFKAIWDTGATNSMITQNVVDQCGLKPTGITEIFTASGAAQTETFLVDIFLPNKVIAPDIKVSRGDIFGADMLVGMDIISRGDFAVTTNAGRTVFSFRMPSLTQIDFIHRAEPNPPKPENRSAPRPQKVGRNAPCPCGSGKKYKKCCGR